MAEPKISRNTGLVGSAQWAAYNLQLALLQGASVTWTAVGLPPGLSINSGTGLISGAATAYGIWHPVVKATNGDGSDQVLLYMPIEATAASAGSDIDLRINLVTREVTPNVPPSIPSPSGIAPAAGQPICVAKELDDLFFSLQLENRTGIVDLDVTAFRATLKELDTEHIICRGGGGTAAVGGIVYFKKYGSGSTATYRVYLRLEDPLLTAALADAEDDAGTSFDARLEFEFEYTNPDNATFGPAARRLAANTVPLRITRPQQPAE